MEKVWHVGMISFRPEATDVQKQEAFLKLKCLSNDCGGKKAGILFCEVRENIDQRKNMHLIEILIFEDYFALQAFKVHPKHKEIGEMLKQIADWWVGDIFAPMP